jgi:hypothetical protein
MKLSLEREYCYLWNNLASGWFLLKESVVDKDWAPYSIINKKTATLLLIENNKIHREVCEIMLKKNVEVLDKMPKLNLKITMPDEK